MDVFEEPLMFCLNEEDEEDEEEQSLSEAGESPSLLALYVIVYLHSVLIDSLWSHRKSIGSLYPNSGFAMH